MHRHDSPGDGAGVSAAVRSIAVSDGSGVIARTFAWSGQPSDERMRWFADGLRTAMLDQGYTEVAQPGPDVAVVLAALDAPPDDLLRTGYPLLVRGLANLCVMVSPVPEGSAAHFVTLEQGTYAIDTSTGDDEFFFKSVFSRVEPLATSRLVIGNEFRCDLREDLWQGDAVTDQITRAGERL